jgi:hypothetical protein
MELREPREEIPMRQPTSLDERIKLLENDVTAIKKRLGIAPTEENWIEKITGTFEGDTEFAEIVKLGAELRRADRPADA